MDGMFKDDPDAGKKAKKIVEGLTDAETNMNHGKHLHREECDQLGLKIRNLEADQEMQDAVLRVHHAFVISLMNTDQVKIIENNAGIAHVKTVSISL